MSTSIHVAFGIIIPCFVSWLVFTNFYTHRNGSRVLRCQIPLIYRAILWVCLLAFTGPGIWSLLTGPLSWNEPLVLLPRLVLLFTALNVWFYKRKWQKLPHPHKYSLIRQLKKVFPNASEVAGGIIVEGASMEKFVEIFCLDQIARGNCYYNVVVITSSKYATVCRVDTKHATYVIAHLLESNQFNIRRCGD